MKILYYTDKHVCPFNEFSKPVEDGKTSLLLEHEETYRWLASLIDEEKPDYVIDIGDTAQTIGYLDGLSLTCISEGERRIDEACRQSGSQIYRLIGNHDLMDDTSRVHVLPYLTNVVDTMMVADNFLFIPFYRHEDEWKRRYETCLEQYPRIQRVCIHLDIVGAQFNYSPTNLCHTGYKPPQTSQFKIYAGHFHHPQQLGPNLEVVGSCMYRTFSDEYAGFAPRGALLETLGRHGEHSVRRIENPCTSIYSTVSVKDENPEELSRKLESLDHPERTYLRMIYPRSLQDIALKYAKDFKGSRLVPLATDKKVSVAVPNISSSFDPNRVSEAYLDTYPVDNRSVYKDYIQDMISRHFNVNTTPKHHVKVLEIHLENYSSYLSADVRFDETGLVYVDGVWTDRDADTSNGSGKSSLFESLLWCLTGSTIQSCGADEVVNNKVGSDCLVSVTAIVEEDDYQFVRTRKHKKYGDDLRIFKNGDLVSKGTSVSKEYLSSRLGIKDEDSLLQTVFLVDGLGKRFTSLNGRQRMEMIEQVIRLDSYDHLYEAIHKDLARIEKEYQSAVADVGAKKLMYESLEKEYNHQNETSTALKQGFEELEAQYVKRIAELQEQIASLTSSLDTKKLQYSQGYQTHVVPHQEKLNEVNKKIAAQRQYIRGLENSKSIAQKTLQDKQKLSKGSCPTCLRPFTVDASVQHEVDSLQQSLQNESMLVDQSYAILAQYEAEAVAAQNAIRDASAGMQILAGKIPSLEHQVSLLRQNLQTSSSELEQKRRAIASLVTNLDQMRNRLESAMLDADLSKSRLDTLEVQQQIAKYWDTGYSPQSGGCRLWLVTEALNQLAEYTSVYASYLSDGYAVPSLSLKGTGNKTTINIDVNTQGASYKRSSSGERRAMDLPLQFALGRLSSTYSGFSCNVMILDEVDDKLDASARRRLVLLLNRIASAENKTILLASHNKDIRSQVDKIWTVKRTDGVSRLIYA